MRILICTTDNPGFVFPTIGLANELSEQGHQVHVVGGYKTAPTIREHGFHIHLPVLEEDPSFSIRRWGMPQMISRQAKIVDRAIDAFDPDVLVAQQLALEPVLSSERHESPLAVLGGASYLWPTTEEDLAAMTSGEAKRHAVRFNGMMQMTDAARSRYGLPKTTSHSYQQHPLLGQAYMLRSVPELLPERQHLPTSVSPVGACLWEPPLTRTDGVEWVRERAVKEPVIYVQFNRTVPHDTVWPMLVDALEDQSVSVITEGVPEAVRPMLDPLGDRVRIEPFVPSSAVLPHLAGVVTTGHTTMVVGALSHGVPLMLIPGGSGSEDVARMCDAAGVSVSVKVRGMTDTVVKKTTDTAMAEKVTRLLHDPDLRTSAREIQATFDARPGFRTAARVVEEVGQHNFTVPEVASKERSNAVA